MMTTKHDVIRLHRRDPALTSVEIAELLGCSPEYVRATFKRNGLVLPHAGRRIAPRVALNPEIAALLTKYAEQERISKDTAANALLRDALGAA